MKKTESQNHWIKRNKNDRFIKLSKHEGYRSRAAYKLLEINEKFKIIKKYSKVADLGASPGGWTQVVSKLSNNTITAVDKLTMLPIKNCIFIHDDIENLVNSKNKLIEQNSYDVVLSDMAANSSGHRYTDIAKSEKICYLALNFAIKFLKTNGTFVCKIMRNSIEKNFKNDLSRIFKKTKAFKPSSSRTESKEIYLVALGFNNLH